MKKFNLPFVILMLIPFSFAHSTTMSEARQGALDFGNIYKNSASTLITEQNKVNTPGYTTDNPDQTKYYSGSDMSVDAQSQIATTNQGKLFTQDLPNRPKVEVSLSDPFLNSARQIETNPQAANEVIAMFTGSYEQCTPIEITATDVEMRTCDFYSMRDGGSCLVNQVVEVEAIHDYQCNKTRNARDKTCTANLSVNCNKFSDNGKDSGVLIHISSHANTTWSYNYPLINIGAHCSYSRCQTNFLPVYFSISNINQIQEFKLVQSITNEYLSIKLNGNNVFSTSIRGTVNQNIDLKPYLINGNNKLEIDIIMYGHDPVSYIKINSIQKYCEDWRENWEEICPE
jgi:hypothetical protein